MTRSRHAQLVVKLSGAELLWPLHRRLWHPGAPSEEIWLRWEARVDTWPALRREIGQVRAPWPQSLGEWMRSSERLAGAIRKHVRERDGLAEPVRVNLLNDWSGHRVYAEFGGVSSRD